MPTFREYDQSQGVFRTIIPNEVLEEEHPARIVDKVVELLDLEKLYAEYADEGNPPYHPKMMVKVLFYSYYIGLMSGRKIRQGLENRADYIYLSGDQVPDFRTINNFRTRHKDILPELFAQIVHLCVKLGMVDFKYLAVDGEKIRASANFQKSMNKERLQRSYERVKKGIQKLLEQEVDEEYLETKRNDRIGKLQKKEKELLEFRKVLDELGDENKSVNMTDADAAVMQHKDKRKLPSYNHQSAVDGKYGITCAVTTRCENDQPKDLFELVDDAKENTGATHQNVMADPGFCSYEVLEKAEKERRESYYLPDKLYEVTENNRSKKGQYARSQFRRQQDGRWICPAGQVMKKHFINYHDGYTLTKYIGTACGSCSVRSKCTPGKVRSIYVDSREPYRERMREKLKSDLGREIYRKRQAIVEPVHGDEQKNKSWSQHHLRGRPKASLEFMLIRIASNLGKIVKYRAREVLAFA